MCLQGSFVMASCTALWFRGEGRGGERGRCSKTNVIAEINNREGEIK